MRRSWTPLLTAALFLIGLAASPAPLADVGGDLTVGSAKTAEDEGGKEKPSRKDRKKKKKQDKKKDDAQDETKEEKKGKSYEDVVKDHEKIDGLFTIYQKDGSYILSLKPEQLGTDFMMSRTREAAAGESFVLAVQMLPANVIRFEKVGENVQLILRNTQYTSFDDPEMKRTIDRSFSDSLVGASKILSEPEEESKAILVEMDPYFLVDPEGAGFFLGTLGAPFRVDEKNSYIATVKGFAENVEVGATVHFAGQMPAPMMISVPDSRSFFVTYRYSLAEIPESDGYIPRIADDRVGHFMTQYRDYSDDTRESTYVYYLKRWDLRKKNPHSDMSEPIKPITYWLENSVPLKYRKPLADGALLWNDAFEAIGFKNALVIKQQPDDAKWDPADSRYATIRWFAGRTASFAIGPSRMNPYTGQIYDADIGWSEGLVANRRREYEELADPVGMVNQIFEHMANPAGIGQPGLSCNLGLGAMQQLDFGLEVLHSRGQASDSPEAEAYVAGFVTYVNAHEVGHSLGLAHNFRASTLHANNELGDTGLTDEQGMTASVMDYVPVNLAAPGQQQGRYWHTGLGTYDYWAIEYAYTEFPGVKTPEDEMPELAAIASLVAEPQKVYGSHEEMSDPRTNVWDLGADPVDFYNDRVALVRELWDTIPETLAADGEGYQAMRRAFGRGLFQYAFAVFNLQKSIGGLETYRDHVGDPDGRPPFVPVPAATQREALGFLTDHLFEADNFEVPPELLNRLAANRWWDLTFTVFQMNRMEYPLHDVVLAIQTNALNAMYNPVKLDRLVDLELLYDPSETPFTLAEMFTEVQEAIWSDVYEMGAHSPGTFRRGLQRAHLDHLIVMVVDPLPGTPEDATTMARANLKNLKTLLDQALQSGSIDEATRAHYEETGAVIEAALSAQMLRLAS